LGLVAPVGARVADAVEVAHRNVDPVVVVLAPGLDQQHALRGVGRQAIGQQTSRRPGTDDYEVETGVTAHTCLLLLSCSRSRYRGSRGSGFAGPLAASPLRGEAPSGAQGGRHFAVGITNSAPLEIDSGQRCMIDFCFV